MAAVKCIDCNELIAENTAQPKYQVIGVPGKVIQPKPRCPLCLNRYEAVRCRDFNPAGGLRKVVE